MMPDKDKKYMFAGLVFRYETFPPNGFPWIGFDGDGKVRMTLSGPELAYQIEQGNAVEVREPREFQAYGSRSINDTCYIILDCVLPDWALGADRFEVTIREVLR